MTTRKNQFLKTLFLTLFLLFILFFSQSEINKASAESPITDMGQLFHIYTVSDMEVFLDYVNDGHATQDAVLEADIDFEGAAYYAELYEGHFYGQRYAIHHAVSPLFITLGTNAVVENLRMEDVNIQSESSSGTGGVACKNTGQIKNCRVSGHIEGEGFVGGIVGINSGWMERCVNYADIVSNVIEQDFTSESRHDSFGAGGIAGVCDAPNETDESDVKNMAKRTGVVSCENYGIVTEKDSP